jgi:hypothetical protein
MIQERTAAANRIQKVQEDANDTRGGFQNRKCVKVR